MKLILQLSHAPFSLLLGGYAEPLVGHSQLQAQMLYTHYFFSTLLKET